MNNNNNNNVYVTIRVNVSSRGGMWKSVNARQNHAGGVSINYYVKKIPLAFQFMKIQVRILKHFQQKSEAKRH